MSERAINNSTTSEMFILEKRSKGWYSVWTVPSKQRHLGDLVLDISCGWVFDIDNANVGFLSAGFLRSIADKLDEMDAELFGEELT